MYKTTVRAATIDDARAISEIHVDSWREAYREILTDEYLVTLDKDARKDFWIESLASPQSKVFVAERERALVGWCAFGQCRDKDKDTNWAEIFAMYVDPEHWGTGIGTILMSQVAGSIASSGFRHVSLWVLKDNAIGRRFYKRVGFGHDGTTEEVQIGERLVIECRYERQLTGFSCRDRRDVEG